MPSKSGRNVSVIIKPSELMLTCEWMDCKETFQCMNAFTEHVTEHLKFTENQTQLQELQEPYACHWRECNAEVDGGTSAYQRHVFFHLFHVKIKCIGALLTEKTGRNACTLDPQCRNLIPELPERLECGWDSCHQFYENAEMFYRHVENHTLVYPEGNNVENGCLCQWEGCGVRVKSRYKLREHLRSHTQEKVVACPTCGNLFCSRTKYFDHVTRQMDVFTGKRYQCSHCNRTYPLERILRDHMRNHVNQYKCLYCDMTMPSPASLRKHIRYRHSDEKPFSCEECTYRCKAASDLRKHMEVHNKEGAYTCEMEACTYSAQSYANLASHIKNVHEQHTVRQYQCHLCKSRYTRGTQLTNHLKRNHKFKWPSGHSRFRYKHHSDGLWRLQTVRYETVRLSVPPETEEEGQEVSIANHPVNYNSIDPDQPYDPDQVNIKDIMMNIEGVQYNQTDMEVGGVGETSKHPQKRRKISKNNKESREIDIDNREETPLHNTEACEFLVENSEHDDSKNMVEVSIMATADGKYLLQTAGSTAEPMTIMMSDCVDEATDNTYNLQMLGDVALHHQVKAADFV